MDRPFSDVSTLFDVMIDSYVVSPDSSSCLAPASIRVLAINLQPSDLGEASLAWLDSRSSFLSVAWGASSSLSNYAGESCTYDLILVGQIGRVMSSVQVGAVKQVTGAGLALLLDGDEEETGSAEFPAEEGVWKIPEHVLPIVLPWVLEQCIERQRLMAEQARRDTQLRDMEYRLETANLASTVLHNVGNVLSSVNVAGKVLENLTMQSSVVLINRMSDLLIEHEEDWMTYLSEDPKGKKLLPLLKRLGGQLIEEQQALLKEIHGLQRHLSHVRHIILSHQTRVREQNVLESVAIEELLEEALELSFQPGDARWVTIQREFLNVPPVLVEKHQMLQILVNLFRNAKQAMQQKPQPMHTLSLSTRVQATEPHAKVEVIVQDTGTGIAPEHLSRMFQRGFTTKKEGNGIGLHSSAMTLEKLGGSLSVHSAGVGLGATFTLAIPMAEERGSSAH